MQHNAVWYKHCEATCMAFSVPVFSLPGQIEQQMFQFLINPRTAFLQGVSVVFVYVVYGLSVFALWIFYKSSWMLKIIYPSFEKNWGN